MIVWFLLTALSLIFVIIDLAINTPVSWVQKLAWILVIAYTGPIGLFVFLLSCRSPGRGLHDVFTKASWKQGVNSEMHCLAGDATGIIISAAILSFFLLSPGTDLVLEYIAAWITGLFIFQALMMLDMFGNNYLKAVRRTIFVETVSMNMVMVGMIPVMVVLLHEFPSSDQPGTATFWFRMSMAAVVGGVTGFPINWWLVSKGLKHGCMTVPEKGSSPHAGHDMASHAETEGHQSKMQEGMKMDHDMASHAETEGHQSKMQEGMKMDHDMDMDMESGMSGCHDMKMPTLPIWQQIAWVLGTFGLLALAVWITTMFAPISF
ncbi:MAG: DUF4396 domain-containing protein [Planctomycetota bacterium]|nr:DUF4396 domain-containing protein [Planctomycetota bacterium]